MAAVEIVEPGRYDYDIKVEFPSTYIPEHTPPAFRNAAAYPATRTRYASGQFDLTAHVGRDALRDHLVRQFCEDVSPDLVLAELVELTPAGA